MRILAPVFSLLLALAATRAVSGQDTVRELQLVDRGPRFLSAPTAGMPSMDASDAPVFRRRVTLELERVRLAEALAAIGRQAGIRFAFGRDRVPVDRLVSVSATLITVASALHEILLDTDLDVQLSPNGLISLVPRSGTTGRARMRQAAGRIVGRVTESATGHPLGDAAVVLEATSFRARSDGDGQFTMSGVPAGSYRVMARALGYAPSTTAVTVTADSATRVSISLVRSAARLDEVVTTATGSEPRRQVGNVIATIQADSIVPNAPVMTLSDVLNARAPGVQVLSSGGTNGSAPRISIRGQNSATLSGQPLLVIDGARVDNSYGHVGFLYPTTSGRLDDLNPDELESIEIVKGPSAATLYGTDAANGVILVTTKRGVTGRPRWSVFGEAGLLTIDETRLPDSYHAWGHTTDGTNTPVHCTLLALAAQSCVQDSITAYTPLRDPTLSPVSTGYRNHYGVQIAGGSGARYFIAADYDDETGALKLNSTDFARLAAERGAVGISGDERRPNGTSNVGLRANLNTNLARALDAAVSTGLITRGFHNQGSSIWFDGELGPGYRNANDGYFDERPSQSFGRRQLEDVTHFTGSASPTWRPLPWLVARATAGTDVSNAAFDELARTGEDPANAFFNAGYREFDRTNITLHTIDLGSTARFDLSPWLTSKTSVGGQYNKRRLVINQQFASGLLPGSQTVAGGSALRQSEQTLETIVAGGYAEQTFGLNGRLFLTGAVREDGGSAFGRNFHAAVYPKGSVSWLVSEEPFWPRNAALSTLRLRAAYGSSGVQPAPTAALASIQLSSVFLNGSTTSGALLQSLGNTDLKPETQTEFESGFDADLVVNRVHLEATYYNKQSRDALVDLPLAASVGGGSRIANVGAVRNWGYEADARVEPVRTPIVTWDVTANGSINHNQVLSLGTGITTAEFGAVVKGYPLYGQFNVPILGYSDLNHDGIIEPNEVTVGSKPVFEGQGFPKTQFTYGTSLALFRERLRLSAQLDHRGGFLVGNFIGANTCYLGVCRAVNDPHASLHDQARAVALTTGSLSNTYWGYYEDGSFTRFRELAVTYTLPTALARAGRVQTATVTLSARNIALWTKYTGVDPEVNDFPDVAGSQYQAFDAAFRDNGATPPNRVWLIRVNLGL